MNDEFLTQFLEAPRAEFADALYERISQQAQPRFPETIAKQLTFRNAVVAFIFMVLVAACVYAVTEKRWNKVGDIWVDVQKTLKVDVPAESETFSPQDHECFTIAEARGILDFDFQVPAWAPEGFTLSDKMCGIDQISDYAYLFWDSPDKNTGISLNMSNLRWFNIASQKYEVGPASTEMFGMPVAPGSYKEVQVHGQPAVLVRGDWEEPWATAALPAGSYEFKWDKKRALQLYWVDGEVLYYLHTSAKVSPEDLIKMAESAR